MDEHQHGPAHILHVDMDAFYASVELVRRPELRGKPVIVGGEGQRGVVAAASYEARVYGIRSAMASVQARRLCPDAVFLPGDHAHYAEVSGRVMSVLKTFTPLVEPLSLDEAFLDVSGSAKLHGQPAEIGSRIRTEIFETEQLTCSVGVAPNKFLAKLATEEAKPTPGPQGPIYGTGVFEVHPDRVQQFLDPLPVRAIWGVGPATASRLDRLGVATVHDLRMLPRATLVGSLGNAHGSHLYELARGWDDRSVEPDQGIKSVSHEETFATDLFDGDRLDAEAVRMADSVGNRLRAGDIRGRTINIKVRFGDFRTITRAVTVPSATNSGVVIATEAKRLLSLIDLSPGVRLLGVGVSALSGAAEGDQLSFDDLETNGRDWSDAEDAVDDIRGRFGDSAIGPASSLGRAGLRAKRRGDQQWGPSDEVS
ncbi:MAG: DNA polymerase IV [Acidimicrobiales bacterium]